eukprot:155413-Pelagomonas_calceolata.AAC.1
MVAGDTVVRGLCLVRPTVRKLRMEEVPFSGSGLRGIGGPAAVGLGGCPLELQAQGLRGCNGKAAVGPGGCPLELPVCLADKVTVGLDSPR